MAESLEGQAIHTPTADRDERFRRFEHNDATNLLSLPQELRDEIYKYTVVVSDSSNCLDMTTRASGAPALSKVCHALRNEVLPIFYKFNVFQIVVVNYDISAFATWGRIFMLMGAYEFRLAIKPIRASDAVLARQNLMQLLQIAFSESYARRILRYKSGPDDELRIQRLASLFAMVRYLRKAGFEWEKVQKAVEHGVEAAMVCGETPA